MSAPDEPLVVVIAGLGNLYRRDDGVGPRVATLAAASTGATVIGPFADPLDLLGWWDHADLAVVIDATRSGAAPGTLRVVEMDRDAPGSANEAQRVVGPSSTHGIGLAGVLRLSRAVGRCPGRVVLVGVEGSSFDAGEGLSPEVEAAVDRAVSRVVLVVGEVAPCA